jgi:hypothetical protein
MTMPFQPGREARWEYAGDTIEHIERENCSKGCQRPSPGSVTEDQPGGDCGLLAKVMLEEAVDDDDMTDNGIRVRCWARVPLTYDPHQMTFPLVVGVARPRAGD